jgi:hypothetical protein
MTAAKLTPDEVRAMDRVVDYLFTDERENYETSEPEGREGHIFNQVLILKLAIDRFHKEGLI